MLGGVVDLVDPRLHETTLVTPMDWLGFHIKTL